MSAIRSTDRDLLVIQTTLGKMRYPKATAANIDKAIKDAERVLSKRFIEDNYGDGNLSVRNKKQQKMVLIYEMVVGFRLNAVTFEGVKYQVEANFNLQNVEGVGNTEAACLQDAKDNFRKYLCGEIRSKDSSLRKSYFDLVSVLDVEGNTILDPRIKDSVAELFRVWIGEKLRKVDSPIRKKFAASVQYQKVNA